MTFMNLKQTTSKRQTQKLTIASEIHAFVTEILKAGIKDTLGSNVKPEQMKKEFARRLSL